MNSFSKYLLGIIIILKPFLVFRVHRPVEQKITITLLDGIPINGAAKVAEKLRISDDVMTGIKNLQAAEVDVAFVLKSALEIKGGRP